MNVFALMLTVTCCYTISSLSDKYAASTAKFSGNEFTFLMCSSMSVFLALSLPFQEIYFKFCPQAFAAVLLIAVCKMLEFQTSVLVLKQLSAFELKAWLGVNLFVSYITDILCGAKANVLKFIFIAVTVWGLVFIARSGADKKINYRKIIIPLALYLASKFGYGLIIKSFAEYASSTMQLLPALAIISAVTIPKAMPKKIFQKNPKGTAKVILARIPNTVGMLAENAVISISLSDYAFVQPMILVTLFAIGLIRKETYSKLNLIGSVICVIGVISFQICGNLTTFFPN
ncbi:MAG: hypothetical protein NC253_04275 [Ruminococcus sp.]|nr:hypothetical protein [Ruminococcus sp.]MCM1380765.1 hypothetical protein [Muribaculaceae bacterium]MCM1478446.1 hypothetical protein [Muribaculaceae bacterium]